MNLLRIFSTEEPEKRITERWVKTYSTEFYRFTALRLNNTEDAEDIVQQTFLKAYTACSTFTQGTNERAWLYTILNNCIKDHLTKLSRQPATITIPDDDSLAESADQRSDPASIMQRTMDLEELSAAISALPEPFATPLLMHCVSGMKYEDIAKTLAIPTGTVMSRLSRARKALSEKLWSRNEGHSEKLRPEKGR